MNYKFINKELPGKAARIRGKLLPLKACSFGDDEVGVLIFVYVIDEEEKKIYIDGEAI